MPMRVIPKFLLSLVLLVAVATGLAPSAARAEQRIALVLGNAAYQAGQLTTPANDAGLIAQTLEAGGFDVIGARDLDLELLRRAFRDFIAKAATLGPDGVAVIYLSGYGLQLEGENYFVPIDARIQRDADVAVEAVRLSDYTRGLAALKLKVTIVILDLARAHPFAQTGQPLAGGLAMVDPEPGMLFAFNAAPGTVAATTAGSYGSYAQALAEMMREGGLPLDAMFDRVRLRVSDVTRGGQLPWHASNVEAPFLFFERTADAPASVIANEQNSPIRSRPLQELGAQEAYIAALERDTLRDYLAFLTIYPDDPLAKRVRAIVAARREAMTWRRTHQVDTPAAYWSYLQRYPNGPHAADVYRRLAFLRASLQPPAQFSAIDYEVPEPPPYENVYLDQPTLSFGDPAYDFSPPPPLPETFLPPPPQELIDLPPPPPPEALFELPTPIYTPVPVWVRPPRYVEPPTPNNVIFVNVHNKVVIDKAAKTFTVTERSGQTRTMRSPSVVPDEARAGWRRCPQTAAAIRCGARAGAAPFGRTESGRD